MSTLEKELETYRQNLPGLLPQEGKFVLIHNGDLSGTFDTYADAVAEGYKVFKLEPFLVKQIQQFEQAHFVASVLV